jgi:haloalkane dehalogenase
MPTVGILDSFMSYRDTGDGDVAVVFLHGNPLSSYCWRDVIPHVADRARCLAPDLIGMGESGKPDIAYRFADHARYLDGWFDEVAPSEVVIVGHDWGGALGMDWAARHASRVRGIAVVETFLRPVRWDEMAPAAAERFRGFRSPQGEEMILQKNMMIESNLALTIASGLAESDLDVYRAPFLEPASRKPMLVWTREFPLDGDPADVAERVLDYGRWIAVFAARGWNRAPVIETVNVHLCLNWRSVQPGTAVRSSEGFDAVTVLRYVVEPFTATASD